MLVCGYSCIEEYFEVMHVDDATEVGFTAVLLRDSVANWWARKDGVACGHTGILLDG